MTYIVKNGFFLLFFVLIPIAIGIGIIACGEADYTPKPRAYPKVNYPDSYRGKKYNRFDEGYCDFTFEKPTYAKVVQDTLFFDEKPESECWFDLIIPSLAGKIHCSYREIGHTKLDKLINDTYNLAHKHNVRADYIDDYHIRKPNGVSSTIFEIEGEVASPFQFYVTDSTKHFLRGSLYFDTTPNADSMAPIIEFVKHDIIHLVNTFEWTD